MTKHDYRSHEAAAYRKWYNTKAWKQRRRQQLVDQPWCEYCSARGDLTLANIADHVVPHRGDYDLFFNGPLQSLCSPCHDARKQIEERHGYSAICGLDGLPLDPNHPNGPKSSE